MESVPSIEARTTSSNPSMISQSISRIQIPALTLTKDGIITRIRNDMSNLYARLVRLIQKLSHSNLPYSLTHNPMATQEQLDILKSKFSMINWPKFEVEIEPSTRQDWISIRLYNRETWRYYSICSWDYDWIMTPGKIEMHLFSAGQDIGGDDIFDNYTCVKK